VPGLPARAARENVTPLDYMRRYGAFEIATAVGSIHDQPVLEAELVDIDVDGTGRVYTAAPKPAGLNIVPLPTPEPDARGRRLAGVMVEGRVVRGFPTPSGRLEFYSSTLAQWGWPEYALPTYIRSHIHRDRLAADELPLIPTFRLPVHIHTRSANAKWLDEIAHTNPLWIHPTDAARLGVRTGDLVRVETAIGYFVVNAWVSEGIRAGVLACSHHMGRWQIGDYGQRQLMTTVRLDHEGREWRLNQKQQVAPYASPDPDTQLIWWREVGVHQNLAFPVHPDPISGMHCWHQAVRIRKAEGRDRHGDVTVDTAKSAAMYHEWMAGCRSALTVSPDGTRRPYWLLRPLKPARDAYALAGTRHREAAVLADSR
jgi:molydopterin dinucleotide binding protein